jgi:acyl-CoA reductase-like NAD-dependent aldehyde dehydrogenase
MIVSFNYPLLLASWKIAPALACGNCIVLKPSPLTPLSCLHFAHLVSDILPPGVLNIVPGDATIGAALTSNPLVAKISFTGSLNGGINVAKGILNLYDLVKGTILHYFYFSVFREC